MTTALPVSGLNGYQMLTFIESVIVNRKLALTAGFEVTILAMLILALLVNIVSMVLIMKRESTLVNTLLCMHCTAISLLSVLNSIAQYKPVENQVFCAPATVLYSRCFVELGQFCI